MEKNTLATDLTPRVAVYRTSEKTLHYWIGPDLTSPDPIHSTIKKPLTLEQARNHLRYCMITNEIVQKLRIEP